MICPFCREEVDPFSRRNYHLVQGWVRDRSAGGVNALRQKKIMGEVAHAHCVERVVPIEQTSLLDA